MALRLFDYACEDGHVSEILSDGSHVTTCPICSRPARKQLSAPNVRLEGLSGSFPGAADKWVRLRESKMAAERRCKERHGTYS